MLGVFDFGITGLMLVQMLRERFAGVRIVYYGDTEITPVGSCPSELIYERCRSGCDFLLEQGATAIILACHTASACAGEMVRGKLPVPLIDTIGPVTQGAVEASTGGRVGLIGSEATIASTAYQRAFKALAPETRLFTRASPLLAPLVEAGRHKKKETKMILKHYLRPFKDYRIDTLVPACSHYQLLAPLIAPRIGRKVRLLDPFSILLNHCPALGKDHGAPSDPASDFTAMHVFVSKKTSALTQRMHRLLGQRCNIWKR